MINSFKTFIALILIFTLYESFGLFPEALLVPIPGVVRLSDSFFIVFLLVYVLPFGKIIYLFREHTHASLLVVSGCLLVILGMIMAQFHFDQPFFTGLLKLRQLLTLLLFFVLLALISNEKETVFFIKGLLFLVGVIGVLSLIQYFLSGLPIFRGEDIETIYSGEKYLRHGSYRIFFPAASLGVLIYFYVLGEIIAVEKPQYFYWKIVFLTVLLLLFYLQQTRARLLTVVVITIYALITSKKSNILICAFVLILIFTCSQSFFNAISNKELIDLKNSKIYKLTDSVLNIFETEEASINDRFQQLDMYWYYFKRYPIMGAGTLAIESPLSIKYRLYNTSDLGYVKLLCEYGILGFFWFVWLFVYVYKRTGEAFWGKSNSKDSNMFKGVIKGTRLFYLYVAITMLTLPHFGRGHTITYMVISLVLLELVVKLSVKKHHEHTVNY